MSSNIKNSYLNKKTLFILKGGDAFLLKKASFLSIVMYTYSYCFDFFRNNDRIFHQIKRSINYMENIFEDIPFDLPDELIEKIAGCPEKGVAIERIISRGHSSPPGFWYDQDKTEFVILLKGKAALLFKENDRILEMLPGDYVEIPAHALHRVEWTSEEEDTFWLALFY